MGVERGRLVALLGALTGEEWGRASPCPGWSVLGLATHLVGDDLSLLAGHRDGHLGTPSPIDPADDEEGFVRWLDALQVEWVHAARRLSPRLVVDLLGWLDGQVSDLVAAEDPRAVEASVSWAATVPVPRWLDHARELTERWIHRQQLLQALDRPPDLRPDLAGPVLDGLRWAYPFRLGRHPRPAGTTVVVAVTGPEVVVDWTLVVAADGTTWDFAPDGDAGDTRPPDARLALTTDQAWRLLTNNLDPEVHGEPPAEGDPELVATLRHTRAILGLPQ